MNLSAELERRRLAIPWHGRASGGGFVIRSRLFAVSTFFLNMGCERDMALKPSSYSDAAAELEALRAAK